VFCGRLGNSAIIPTISARKLPATQWQPDILLRDCLSTSAPSACVRI
jgi:hypothetical protein